MADKLLKRNEVPVEETWDLSLLYKSDEELNADIEKAKEIVRKMITFKGKLNSAEAVNDCLSLYEQFIVIDDHATNYVGLDAETDHTNSAVMEKNEKVTNIFNELETEITFMDSEIARADEEVLKKAMETCDRHNSYLKNVLRSKPHMLSDETERALAALNQTLNAP